MTELKSDDTEDRLTVTVAGDADMWIGVNGFNLIRFRNGIGGGMYPHTYVALRNLETAMKRDITNRENGGTDISEWTIALKDLKVESQGLSPAMQKVKEIVDEDEGWQLALCAISHGKIYHNDYVSWMREHWEEVEPITYDTFDLIYKMYKAAL
ncbi:hypothetical protein VPHK437A_0047 [Vibrio phage K437a]